MRERHDVPDRPAGARPAPPAPHSASRAAARVPFALAALFLLLALLLPLDPAGRGLVPLAAAGDLPVLKGLLQGPVIRFDERTWDFGKLAQYTRREHTFTIRNDGTEDLLLLKIEPDCGCMLAEPADTVIAPGESTSLRVVLDTRDFQGEQRKVVILQTNDPAEPRIDLLLLADVKAELECRPRALNYGHVRRGTTPVLSVQLDAEGAERFRVLPPTEGIELIDWRVTREPERGKNAYRLDGAMRADAPFGKFNRWVEIPCEHPKQIKVRISIRGLVHAYFAPADGGINFGTPSAGDAVERSLRIDADGSRPYRIQGATASSQVLSAEVRPEGNGYVLTVRLRAPESMALREKVILATTDPEQPSLEIEIKANVLPPGGRSGRS